MLPFTLTAAPFRKPVPDIVSVGLPVTSGLGLMAVIAGPAGSRFTYTAPMVLSAAAASTRMLAVGILDGAV